VYRISMEAVLPNKDLSINESGIAPLGEKREAWIFKQVEQLAKKHKFSLTKPVKDLPESALNLVLYGKEVADAEEEMNITDEDVAGSTGEYGGVFEGVIPMIRRWFSTSSSDSIRDWAEGFMTLQNCPTCKGTRLKKESLWFKVAEKNISELSNMNLDKLMQWMQSIDDKLTNKQVAIGKEVLKEIRERLQFLLDVGLTYLTLNRPSKTLSGGESQRIRLATQIGSQLQGITYILDEPSIGLHQRDNHRLITAMQNLRDIGNSVLVVEHDKDIMLASDYLIDIGPKAGKNGGTIVSQGTPADVLKTHSETAQYLNGEKKIAVPETRRPGNGKVLE
ncbi:MAG: excinuclease ABC subunit UvrA, partial [Hymenobacter sp.]